MNFERSRRKKVGATLPLQLFFFGPGVGESMAIRLPCGGWGVVDCYMSATGGGKGVLGFLEERKVERLAFFCWTHPHSDHFKGAYLLLDAYSGKIERIWRHPGFTRRDITVRVVLAAKIKECRTQDPEAGAFSKEYLGILAAVDRAKQSCTDGGYRRVIAPISLLKGDGYKISALRPTSAMLDDIEARIARFDSNEGALLLSEEEGAVLNSLSVVLLIEFGRAKVFLLGDSQGAGEELQKMSGKVTVVKVAHHGSENGLGAAVDQPGFRARCGVIMPYARSGLPSERMVARYRASADNLILTGPRVASRVRKVIPGARQAWALSGDGEWKGVEITEDGRIGPCQS